MPMSPLQKEAACFACFFSSLQKQEIIIFCIFLSILLTMLLIVSSTLAAKKDLQSSKYTKAELFQMLLDVKENNS